MSGPIVECVPNFSEGTDARRVEAIVAAMRVDGVHLLDWSMDADHNRSLVTLAGDPAAMVEAAVRGVGKAVELIDLTRQQGVHPRIGAADVIPFVPISGIKLEQCALLARQAGLEIWRRFSVPVFFYEAAAARPDRANVEEVRRGQFEGLRDAVAKDSSRRPRHWGSQHASHRWRLCALARESFWWPTTSTLIRRMLPWCVPLLKEIRAAFRRPQGR
jgi:glutamate formiminotransferase